MAFDYGCLETVSVLMVAVVHLATVVELLLRYYHSDQYCAPCTSFCGCNSEHLVRTATWIIRGGTIYEKYKWGDGARVVGWNIFLAVGASFVAFVDTIENI